MQVFGLDPGWIVVTWPPFGSKALYDDTLETESSKMYVRCGVLQGSVLVVYERFTFIYQIWRYVYVR